MSIKKKLIRNTMANYGIQLWTYVLNFVMMPIIIYFIGVVEYGIYLLVTAFIGYFGLLDLGIGRSLLKFIAEYHARKDKDKLNEVINTAFFIFLGIGIVGAIGLFIIGTFFIGIFNLEGDLLLKAKFIIYLLAITFITSFSLSTFKNIMEGIQRYDILAYISFIISLVNIAVTVTVLLLGYGIVELLFYTICFGLIGYVIITISVHKYLPYITIKSSYLNRDMVRTLFGLSLFLLFFLIFARIIYYTDTLVIGFYLGAAMITFYTAAWKISQIPNKAILMTLSATIPATSELDALKKKKALQLLFLRASKYCLGLLLLLGLPTLFMSKEILKYWVGWTGGDFSLYHLVVNILIVSLFFDFFNLVSFHILTGMNKIKFLITCYGVVAILNLILSIVLVQKIGLEGVALGTALPFIVMSPFFIWYTFRTIEIYWKDYITGVLFTTLPHALLMGLVLFLLTTLHKPNNLIEVGVYYIVGGTIYFLLFYFKGLNENERADLKGIFKSIKYREDMEIV